MSNADALKAWREAGGVAGPRLDPIQKAAANPKSLRLAITAKCWECMGGGLDPGTREAIRSCTSPACPLYPLRPFQS
jgi:hypothetical protein